MECPELEPPSSGPSLERAIYFVPDDAPRSLRYFDFSTRQIRPIFELDKDFGSGSTK